MLRQIPDALRIIARDRRDPLRILNGHRPEREDALKLRYAGSPLSRQPDTFVLYRIIGNDLYPRHQIGQSRSNLRFILDNERDFPNCEKRWIVNRIANRDEEQAILDLLKQHRQDYIHIPFVDAEYRGIKWDFSALPRPGYLVSPDYAVLNEAERSRLLAALHRYKNNYVMNNNGARNAALSDGVGRAKWVLPWDGNCFLTEEGWAAMTSAIVSRAHLKYFAVPMARVADNSQLLTAHYRPHPSEEPQLVFRSDAEERFNEEYCYGRRPKVEMFWRLGIPGPWRNWRDDPWDQKRRPTSEDAGAFGVAGWVARLSSGSGALERSDKSSFVNRGKFRNDAIIATIAQLDQKCTARPAETLTFYSPESVERAGEAPAHSAAAIEGLAGTVLRDADQAMKDGPFSVLDKRTLPPSGNRNDYWHPAPYYWPNPRAKDGLPYVARDGLRVPGTVMYEPASADYDRTHLQLMLDGTVSLTLAWTLTERIDYAQRAALYLRQWFIAQETRMTPHLEFAQVRMGHNRNRGSSAGIIEFKDLYFFLDAVRLLEKSAAVSADDIAVFRDWLVQYQDWLETSPQGRTEVATANNHGTYFDLQTASIAFYLGDWTRLRDILLRAASRIGQQFTASGEQPHELARTNTRHYCYFNLQGWLNLLTLGRQTGLLDADFDSEPFSRVRQGLKWTLAQEDAGWPFEQIEPFDQDRVFPLLLSAWKLGVITLDECPARFRPHIISGLKPRFDPHAGVQPYWNLDASAFGSREDAAN